MYGQGTVLLLVRYTLLLYYFKISQIFVCVTAIKLFRRQKNCITTPVACIRQIAQAVALYEILHARKEILAK